MQLNYRGINYETESSVLGLCNSNPADATLKYRGVKYDTNLPVVADAVLNAEVALEPLSVAEEASVMALSYRGVRYETNSPVLELRHSNPANAVLKYRGTTYGTNTPVEAAADVEVAVPLTETVSAPAVATYSDRARALMMKHHRQVKQRQQVMLSRLATSIGLDASETSQYWNHIQGKVHPSFWATYDRSHAASS